MFHNHTNIAVALNAIMSTNPTEISDTSNFTNTTDISNMSKDNAEVLNQVEPHQEKLLKQMQKELNILKDEHPRPNELDEFFVLYQRYIKNLKNKIKWEKISDLKEKIIDYTELNNVNQDKTSEMLSKLAILKLNGGLGTTMGCKGPKSGIKIKGDMNFIDITVKQLANFNKKYNCKIPLILMNSFNTDHRTTKLIRNYDNILTFMQSMFPRISEENLMPIETAKYYPPGHGDIFYSLKKSGILDKLLNEGKEYLFISNVDNLAATADLKILQTVIEQNIDFCIELTKKTRADIKGGTLVNYDGKSTLLEIAQVPAEKKTEFTNIKKFKTFNTNSIWINLKTLSNMPRFELDIISNKKIVDGERIIQLETAMGSAVKYFKNNCGILVPRSRFLPVKTCSDLFQIESSLYSECNGILSLNKKRVIETQPIVKLIGPNFATIDAFESSFAGIPDIVDLEMLTVTGNVTFGKDIVLKGTVIISAEEGAKIHIPDGSVLEDKILSGNLSVIDL